MNLLLLLCTLLECKLFIHWLFQTV